MAKETRKGGGSKLQRSETVTVRIDPKLRYLAELAARHQRRTLSSYIDCALSESLEKVTLNTHFDDAHPLSQEGEHLWDVDDADRLVKLGVSHPYLLNYEEQALWKIISSNGYFWNGEYDKNGNYRYETIYAENPKLEVIRKNWELIKAVAAGEKSEEELPKLPSKKD